MENKESFLRELVDKGEAVHHYDADPFTPELEKRYDNWLKRDRK